MLNKRLIDWIVAVVVVFAFLILLASIDPPQFD